ncbi:hypothetical protein MPSEU_000249200 [Mayamaea pseudoterrestris]|nr:hypothetical protein MPSEU_000249200 [Mayamaea pseudoterrestris]
MIPLLQAFTPLLTLFAMSKAVEEDSERLARWKSRWDDNKIGWHEASPHESIINHGHLLFPTVNDHAALTADSSSCSKPLRVFVPLCGKSVDMAYFAKQDFVQEVVGVDGIQKALDAFAAEHADLNLQPAEPIGQYDQLKGEKITLLRGDFFEMDEADTSGRFDVIFDRASMVAIEPSLREDYLKTIGRLLAPGGKILLVTIERTSGTDEDKGGPPFSIPEAEVRRLYEAQTWVDSVSILPGNEARNEGSTNVSHFFLIQAT